MRRRAVYVSVVVVAALGFAGPARAQNGYDPMPPPSRWGPHDEAGASNTQTAEKVLEATQLIRTGRKYLLGHEYTLDMPLFPGNTWAIASRTAGVKRQVFNAEHIAGDIAQNGTQFDGLGHFGLMHSQFATPLEAHFYNRFTGSEVLGPTGLRRLGVENMKPFFTRGVLIDIKRYVNQGRTLEAGREITVDMVKTALAAQQMNAGDIGEGDAVLFVTGWEEFWDDGTLRYYAGAPGLVTGATPGIGLELARWLADKRVAVVGADNWGVEVFPAPNAPDGIDAPVHNELIVRNGIPHQESMHLSELADDLAREALPGPMRRKHVFAYIYTPVPIHGASGSPGIPLAVR